MHQASSGPRQLAIVAVVVPDSGDWSGFEPVDELVEKAVAALNQELRLDTGVGWRVAVVLPGFPLEERWESLL